MFSLCCLLSSVTHISFSLWNWFSLLREFTSPTLLLTKGPAHMCCQNGWVGLPLWDDQVNWTQLMCILDQSQIFSVFPSSLCCIRFSHCVMGSELGFSLPELFSVHCRGCWIGFISWSHCGVRFPHSSFILSLGWAPSVYRAHGLVSLAWLHHHATHLLSLLP